MTLCYNEKLVIILFLAPLRSEGCWRGYSLIRSASFSLSLVVPYLNHFKRPRGSLLSESIIELPPLEKRPTLGGINLKQSGPLQDYTQTWCIVTLQALARTHTHTHKCTEPLWISSKAKIKAYRPLMCQCGLIYCWKPKRKKWERELVWESVCMAGRF